MVRNNGHAPLTPSPARSQAYQALSQGLIYPDAAWLAGLTAWQSTLVQALASLGPDEQPLAAALAALPDEAALAVQRLQVEYTRLFINAVPHVLAPPYASAYSGEGWLMGLPAEKAIQAYRQAGLAFTPDDHTLPDHLAAELEFMAFLCQEEMTAWANGDAMAAELRHSQQQVFLSSQLLSWAPAWAQRAQEADRSGFYRALATLIVSWLEFDAHQLAHSLV